MKKYKFRLFNIGYWIEYYPNDTLLFWADNLKTKETHLVAYYRDSHFTRWNAPIYVAQTVWNKLRNYI